jgi:MFS family permease
MLKKYATQLTARHHPWRFTSFSELSEIYVCQLIRSMAVGMVGVFTPYYLYTLGYTLQDILLYVVLWFAFRVPTTLGVSLLIARIGPKRSMFISACLHIVYFGLLFSISSFNIPLWFVSLVGSTAIGIHLLAMSIDFSRFRHADHAGKEISYLSAVEKIGGIIGPLVGGFVGTVWSPRYTIIIAMSMLLMAIVPLFRTKETMRTRQKIRLRGFKFGEHKRMLMTAFAFGPENSISITAWPLYMALFVLTSQTFAYMGVVLSLGTVCALIAARLVGVYTDKDHGRALLVWGVIANSAIHLLRIASTTPVRVLGVHSINEPATAMYRIPYLKGLYDEADSLEGYRIVYMTTIFSVETLGCLIAWTALLGLSYSVEPRTVFSVAFVAASLLSLFLLAEKFAALHGSHEART